MFISAFRATFRGTLGTKIVVEQSLLSYSVGGQNPPLDRLFLPRHVGLERGETTFGYDPGATAK